MIDKTVEVLKAPREAQHLLGKRGVVTHQEGGWYCVKIGERFTHFLYRDIRVINKR